MRRLLLLLILIVWMAGCSPPSFVAQRYANFTAYYNTFHNAQNAFEAGVASLEASEAPIDRDRFLPVFVPPDRVGGGQEFGRAIRKSADILRDHPNSKWVDDALLLIGTSYFYQQNYVGAAQKFREIMALDDSELEGEARFWLARALIQAGNYEAAAEHLRASLDEGAAYGTWTDMMQLARGELLVRQARWQDAAVALERGLDGDPDDRPAARAAFLLGQVREEMGIYSAAARAYEVVNEDYQPRYELSFAAQISALRVRGLHGATDEALRRLRRMERDDKNFEKRAELALLRGRLHQAAGQPDVARRTFRAMLYDDDPVPRAVQGRVHYALGVLHQEAYDDFSAAAAHFDTASTALGSTVAASGEAMGAAPAAITDSPARAELYRNLADKAFAVSRADSLLRLGALSDEAFADAIARIQAQRAEAAAQQRRRAERRATQQQFGGSQPSIQRGMEPSAQAANVTPGEEAGFLFHRSPVQAQEARRNFARRWGERPRVPNWRRRAAITAQSSASTAEPVAADAAPGQTAPTAGRPAAQVDVSAVPRDSASQAAVEAQRAVARYEFANALFLAAGRPDSAAYWYRRVIEEDADQPVARRALYALAEAHQARGDTAAARAVYRRIVDEHPASPFARRAREQLEQPASPTATDSLAQAEAAYERAFTAWEAGGARPATEPFIDVAVAYRATPVAAKALWAAATVFMRAHAGHALHARTPLPAAFGRVLEGSDSTAALRASRMMAGGQRPLAGPPLGALLDHIATHYPETPHAARAKRLHATLSDRTAALEEAARADSARADSAAAARDTLIAQDRTPDPATDSTATDSTATDSTATDSTAAPPTAIDSAAIDSAAIDTAGPPPSRPSASDTARVAPADSAQADPRWAIVLATRADSSGAAKLARAYAARLEAEGLPVRVRTTGPEAAPQYQVTAGRFANEPDATATMQRLRMRLPGTARVQRIR